MPPTGPWPYWELHVEEALLDGLLVRLGVKEQRAVEQL